MSEKQICSLAELLADAAKHPGGSLIVNLASDDPLALLSQELLKQESGALLKAANMALDAMKGEKILLLETEATKADWEGDKIERLTAPRSLVLRKTPAVLHYIKEKEIRACPDGRTYPSEGLEGASAVVAEPEALLQWVMSTEPSCVKADAANSDNTDGSANEVGAAGSGNADGSANKVGAAGSGNSDASANEADSANSGNTDGSANTAVAAGSGNSDASANEANSANSDNTDGSGAWEPSGNAVKWMVLRKGTQRRLVKAAVGTKLWDLLSENGFSPEKPLLLGGLTGRFVPAAEASALTVPAYDPAGENRDFDLVYVTEQSECLADLSAKLLGCVHEESCQKCVLGREGSWQLSEIFRDITLGKGSRENLPMVEDIAPLIAAGAFCGLGRGMARLSLSIASVCKDELTAHIVKKQCPAGFCAAFNRKTYVIDPQKCQANGDCADECPEAAITFKKKFISMIDKDMCTGCGQCVSACEEGAIVVNDGSIRTPVRATRVGKFK